MNSFQVPAVWIDEMVGSCRTYVDRITICSKLLARVELPRFWTTSPIVSFGDGYSREWPVILAHSWRQTIAVHIFWIAGKK
ncbi:hypothetical protein CA603_34950 [Paraburkholderia hospita]|nr:hypothetical protein CA603_34950 [Paraburkholderia hospita]